jgi:predicted Na+-dependent transporter
MLALVKNIRVWIEGNFTVVLTLGVLAGLFAPMLDRAPDISAIFCIAAVIFFSCTKVVWGEMRAFDVKAAALFYALRFVMLPAVLYALTLWLIPSFAVGILLVALMPAGASSTAMAHMVGGNTALALSGTVITNALAPLSVPLMVALCAGQHIHINTAQLFLTLCLSVFVPAALYFGFAARIPPVKAWATQHAQWCSILLLGVMVAVVVGMRRSYFFDKPETVLLAFGIGCVLYALLYALGWWFAKHRHLSLPDQKTYAICSGTNNIALSAALAVLYFSPSTVLFAVTGEVAWVAGIAAFKRWMKRYTVLNP